MLETLLVSAKIAIRCFCRGRSGVTAIEYAIIGIAMASVLAIVFSPSTGSYKDIFDPFLAAISSTIGAVGN